MEDRNCCEKPSPRKEASGLWEGIVYAVAPHTFCILFIIFSVIGSVTGMALVKNFLANRNAFLIIFAVSIIFAVLSAFFYLRRKNCASFAGIRRNWKYLGILFGTIILVNFILFFYIFPATANIGSGRVKQSSLNNLSYVQLKVDIPCPGHAPLITSELKKVMGVSFVSYESPDLFNVYYDQSIVSEDKITSIGIFNNFKAEKIWSRKK
ncbi:MAG: hypothetical protein WC468_03775 [Candidatus Paceibacterota bacterium]